MAESVRRARGKVMQRTTDLRNTVAFMEICDSLLIRDMESDKP